MIFVRNQNYRRKQCWRQPSLPSPPPPSTLLEMTVRRHDRSKTGSTIQNKIRANAWWDSMIGNNSVISEWKEHFRLSQPITLAICENDFQRDFSWSKRCGKFGEAAFVAVEMQTWQILHSTSEIKYASIWTGFFGAKILTNAKQKF